MTLIKFVNRRKKLKKKNSTFGTVLRMYCKRVSVMLFLARYSEVSEPIIFQYIFLRQKSRQKMGSKVERVYGSGVTMGGLGG